ncbi:MAG: GMC family oxidoreductase N-terminal domain-containing protein [Pseudomonadota bacterium]|nr:GMC family oxidoreductase N-terminal domain-containing protein [Pseudomonadota bacterium]
MDFDYIIVGGGSAGCVMANRLSVDPSRNVLLVEAGIDTPPGSVPPDILNSYHLSQANPALKWNNFRAYHQPLPHNAPDRPELQYYDQGKVMGGGSSINYQAANRGTPDDYNEWDEMGATGWDWDNVLQYFRKLERDEQFDGDFHGRSGPLPIRRVFREDWSGFSKATADSFASMGLDYFEDQNGGFEDGYFPMTVNNSNDQRVSAAIAYLNEEVRARKNLKILSNSTAKNIVFNERKAVGVRLDNKGKDETYYGHEIVISAGASHSPAILMRSGIGPAQHLKELGIEVICDRPGVGKNLQDHPGVPTMAYILPSSRHGANKGPALQVGARYSSGVDGCGLNDMFICAIGRAAWHSAGKKIGSMSTWINKPYSRGRLQLRTPHWQDEPEVELNMLSDHRDMERIKIAMRRVSELFEQSPLKAATRDAFSTNFNRRAQLVSAITSRNKFLTNIASALLEGPGFVRRAILRDVILGKSIHEVVRRGNEAIEDHVRRYVISIRHISCTCKMGSESDPLAVTAPDGRVYGVSGLRVADASLFPSVPRANTNIPTIMTAEKIADTIISKA